MNTLKTGILMAALMGLFIAIGGMIGGTGGMMIAFVIAGGMNLFAFWNSDKMLLKMFGARPVSATSDPTLYRMVERLAANAKLPMPKVYISENLQPNAFATGRDPAHGAVCVTTGLMERCSSEELAGVIAHELGHIRNRDTLIMTIVAVMAGAIGMLANMAMFMGGGGGRERNPLGIVGVVLVMLLAPIAAMLVQSAISRSREYEADKAGAEISGRPQWLADALGQIERAAKGLPNHAADANPGTAHMFIINPLHGGLSGLFSTHPPTGERIARLRAMTNGGASVDVDSVRPMPQVGGPAMAPRGPWG
jgi:heat shock protein HtpX